MIKAAVMGHPVSHSLSPLIHNHWFSAQGIEGSYQAVDIVPGDLGARMRTMTAEGYAGFNVTVPHKQKVMALCDRLDETARAIGAVNTIVLKDGKIEGRNTDAFGFISNMQQALPEFSFNTAALILGAGGAARAAIYGLLQEGVPEIRIANRTRENAEMLARDFPHVHVVDWDDRHDACADTGLLVNTTVLGMKDQAALEMDLTGLPDHAIVYDIVYKPLMTNLLQDAASRGLSVVTGIGMLLHQARPAFAAWTGVMPVVTKELEKLVMEHAR